MKRLIHGMICRMHRRLAHIVDNPARLLRGRIGQGVMIQRGCSFVEIDGIRIGNWVYIGPGAQMSGSGGLTIEDNVAIGPDVTVLTSNHRWEGVEYVPFGPELDRRPVRIESHSWIGARVVILPGVTIGKGAIVGAGAVVTKGVPSCAVVAGNPAVVIKWRSKNDFDRLVKEDRLWLRELAGRPPAASSHPID